VLKKRSLLNPPKMVSTIKLKSEEAAEPKFLKEMNFFMNFKVD
jgi:hypothetical protein